MKDYVAGRRAVKLGLLCVIAVSLGFIPSRPLVAAAGSESEGPIFCFDPVSFGAVPNDGLDDREAFQAAVDAGIALHVPVCIGPGNWDITRRPGAGTANIASIRVAGVFGFAIRGSGPTTRLRMLGPGSQADWRLMDIREGSSNVTVSDLFLDGSQRTDTEEQTHLLHLNGPVTGITLERIWFNLPQIPGESGGDCVRLLGGAGAEVKNVTMRRLTGLHCDRSFVAVQRGVHGVLLEDSTSLIVGDQSIDFEPSGGVGVSDFRIVGNRLARGPLSQGGYTVAIGGDGAAVAERIVLASTVMADGGVHVIDAHDVTLDGVVVTGKPGVSTPTLHIRKRAKGIRIQGSTFIRPAGVAGPVVSIHHQSGLAPTDVTIERSVLVQNTTAAPINIESLASFTLANSSIEYLGAPGTMMAVTGRGVIAPLARVDLHDNRFEGTLRNVMRLGQFSPAFPMGFISVKGNLADGVTEAGVRFENGLPTTAAICANDFGGVPPVIPAIPLVCP